MSEWWVGELRKQRALGICYVLVCGWVRGGAFVGTNVYLDLAMGVMGSRLGAVLGGGLICIGKSSVGFT